MKQAMIFAAGMGTRLKPITDTMPKALVRVEGQPLLWHVVTRLKEAGFQRIVVNVHHFAQQIVDYLEANQRFGIDIRISDESDILLDTGGGIRKAIPLFDTTSPVLIHNVDILSNVDLAAFYEKSIDYETDALLLVNRRKTKRYLLFDDQFRLTGWTNIEKGETRTPYERLVTGQLNMFAFSGIHIIKPSLFPLLLAQPKRFPIIQFYIDNCMNCLFEGIEAINLQILDVGKLNTLKEAEIMLRKIQQSTLS